MCALRLIEIFTTLTLCHRTSSAATVAQPAVIALPAMPRPVFSHAASFASLLPAHRAAMLRRAAYSTSTNGPPSTLLSSLRQHLKTAMRERDKDRLAVLKSVLADITNSSKTLSPIDNDLALLNLLKKRISTSEQSIAQFNAASRPDLAQAEQNQVDILQQYAATVQTMDDAQIKDIINAHIDSLKATRAVIAQGDLLKACLSKGGLFDGMMVDRNQVAKIANQVFKSLSH